MEMVRLVRRLFIIIRERTNAGQDEEMAGMPGGLESVRRWNLLDLVAVCVESEGNGKAAENDSWVAFLVPFLGLWVPGEVCFGVAVRRVWLGGGFANGDVQ